MTYSLATSYPALAKLAPSTLYVDSSGFSLKSSLNLPPNSPTPIAANPQAPVIVANTEGIAPAT